MFISYDEDTLSKCNYRVTSYAENAFICTECLLFLINYGLLKFQFEVAGEESLVNLVMCNSSVLLTLRTLF